MSTVHCHNCGEEYECELHEEQGLCEACRHLKVCRDCGEVFDPAKKQYKGGYIDQCSSCSRESEDADIKYVGRPGALNKSAAIDIYRANLKFVRSTLRRELACGFNANLAFSSPVSESKKDRS